MSMVFRLLGPLEVRSDGTTVDLGGRRQRAVLAALAFRANEVATIEYLAQAAWERPPASPESNVRTYVAGLRRLVRGTGEDEARIVTHPSGYLLSAGPHELDLAVFDDAVNRGAQALEDGQYATAAAEFETALGLWRGRPLEGLEVGPLLSAEISHLEERRLAAIEQHALARMELGLHADLVGELGRLVMEYPLRERLWALWMRALYRSGRQADALDAYQRVRAMLHADLGIEPANELQLLQQAILSADPALLPPAVAHSAPAKAAERVGVEARRQLPMDSSEFTGRERELAGLLAAAAAVDDGRGEAAVVTAVIQGMAGVGKTCLAVHAAQQICRGGKLDEIQLWMDLRGFDVERSPADPAAVLESFLRLLGVSGAQMPRTLQERAALYRDRLHGRRVLVLLDNAASEEQVRPLLPGSSTALVLITSRRPLAGLDATQQIHLNALPANGALSLLARIVGRESVAAEPKAAARIVELCGNLPLAITLCGRRLRTRPHWSLGYLADRLDSADQRLTGNSIGDDTVRAAFELSYRLLEPEAQRVFRLLGLHPGADFTADAAAALADTSAALAECHLETLLDESLLQQTEPGRYQFHDLLHAYARQCAGAAETPDRHAAALERVVAWYLTAASAAARALNPHRPQIIEDLAGGPVRPLTFATRNEALEWLDQERANLLAAVHAAADHDLHSIAWKLAAMLRDFFYIRKHWDDWVAIYEYALSSARSLGDKYGQAWILNGLGVAHSDLRDYERAIEFHEQSLELQRKIGDKLGAAWNLNNLGVVYVETDLYEQALDCFMRAIPLFREAGDRRGEALCLNNLADPQWHLKRFQAARNHLNKALAIQHDIGDLTGESYTHRSLGELHHDIEHYSIAIRHYEQALAVSRRLDDRWHAAIVLERLGRTFWATGRTEAAGRCWREALFIFDDLGDLRADEIKARIEECPTTDVPDHHLSHV